jgi:hypothetical protein
MPELDPLVYRAAVQHYNLRLRPGSSVNLVDVISYVEQIAATDTEVERAKWSYVVHDLYAGGTLPIGAYTLDFWTKVAELTEVDGIVSVVSQVPISIPTTVGVSGSCLRVRGGQR